jgi:hypothetical protein
MLDEAGVAAIPGADFEPSGTDFVRLRSNPSRSFADRSGMAPAFGSTNMHAGHSLHITPATRGYGRQPEDTVLYSVVQDHLATLLDTARDRSEHGFGYPWFVERESTSATLPRNLTALDERCCAIAAA